ncbi:MAG TPA: hypothetical protein VEG60_17485 [Candidatus Binatia bacterium]|nr:hypothetical protein [Candidatus Binatia bacterium]
MEKVAAKTTEVRRADPAVRRQAVLFVVLGAVTGALLVAGFERYWMPFRDWLLSDPEKSMLRVKLVLLLSGALASAPLLAFAVYLWFLGAKVRSAQEFPPPGYRVVRDTPLVFGEAAMSRGFRLKALALCLGVVAVLLWLQLWRLLPIR